MAQAIETKYLEPTNYKGSRVRARAQAGSVTVPWDHELSPFDNHAAAAKALAEKLGWGGEWCGGGGATVAAVFVLRAAPAFTVEQLYCAACQAATQYDCGCEAQS